MSIARNQVCLKGIWCVQCVCVHVCVCVCVCVLITFSFISPSLFLRPSLLFFFEFLPPPPRTGPLSTSVGKGGGVSRNHLIRNALNLFANVVHIKSKEGIPTRHKDIDFVIIRENTEGEYIGYEQEVGHSLVCWCWIGREV
jgi:Isocitrate/isopropylmalate dehydrogenase